MKFICTIKLILSFVAFSIISNSNLKSKNPSVGALSSFMSYNPNLLNSEDMENLKGISTKPRNFRFSQKNANKKETREQQPTNSNKYKGVNNLIIFYY